MLTGSLALLSSLDLQRDCWGTQGEGMGPAGETHPSEGDNIKCVILRRFAAFPWLTVFHCLDGSEVICPFISWRTSCFLLTLGSYE